MLHVSPSLAGHIESNQIHVYCLAYLIQVDVQEHMYLLLLPTQVGLGRG